jgi:hypothetical protein
MATTKTRINITADADVEEALRRSAKRACVPVAAKAAEFLRLALEIEEDLMLASVADNRLQDSSRFIKHEKAWGKL